jgi:DNA repair photolyase
MKRFTGHKEAWGEFIDIKNNGPNLLESEVIGKQIGRVWISGICDPYQPIERKYELTRKCIEILLKHNWPVTIQTKSPLVLRDIDLFGKFEEIEAGLTISTANEEIKQIFEPKAPPIEERIKTLERLHLAGIKTYAMIAPLLPEAEDLAVLLSGKVDNVLIDKMNYHYADWVYKKHHFEYALKDKYFNQKGVALANAFKKEGIFYQILF